MLKAVSLRLASIQNKVGVAVLLALPMAANAAIDTTDIEAAITDAATAAGVIGAAWLIYVLGIKVWKSLRGAA